MPHRPVRQVMAKQILAAPASRTVTEAAALMKRSKFGALMVVEGARLVGIFTERDALYRVLAEKRDPDVTLLGAVMTPNPRTIEPDHPFGHALHMMYDGGFRHVPVVENGCPVGMVSARDALGPELAEFASELEAREHIGEILG
ncbi:MAG TPA: CBS domain-containing protein [Burkholderiales bacterium]